MTMSKPAIKNQWRKKISSQLTQIPPAVKKQKSMEIIKNLATLTAFQQAQSYFIYISTEDEVDTHDLIKYLLQKNTLLTVPKIHQTKIQCCQLQNWQDLIKNKYQVLEPKFCYQVQQEIDIAIIPGRLFSQQMDRLGRGLGYYDQFLKKFNGMRIALAFDQQIVDHLPSEKHDQKVNMIVTESRIIYT